MPVMNGLDSTKAIRAQVAPDYQPYIVALTAQAMQGDRYLLEQSHRDKVLLFDIFFFYISMLYSDQCLSIGMNAYITKPLAKEDVVRVLTTAPRLARNTQPDMILLPTSPLSSLTVSLSSSSTSPPPPPPALIATANILLNAASLPK
jgi:CheY-like chemotaxis protein